MGNDNIAEAVVTIDAPAAEVWDALTNPEKIRKYMFGATVESDWREGSPIRWRGEWQGKTFEDSGHVLKAKPEQLLQYSHSSPNSGHHQITIELSGEGSRTQVVLRQDNNPTEEARKHSEQNWNAMLGGLKRLLERRGTAEAERRAEESV